jgi:hypothetical protein
MYKRVATLFVFIEACLSSVISALKAMGLSKKEMPIELHVSLFIKPTVIFCFVFPHDTQQVPIGYHENCWARANPKGMIVQNG